MILQAKKPPGTVGGGNSQSSQSIVVELKNRFPCVSLGINLPICNGF